MPRVFHREGDHPYNEPLEELDAGTALERSVSRNLRCEPHVSEARESRFDAHGGAPGTGPAMLGALDRFQRELIHRADPPEFLEAHNARNHAATVGRYLAPDEQLAHVLDLGGLELAYRWGREHGGHRFLRDYGDWMVGDGALRRWLETRLTQDPEAFVRDVFALLNDIGRRTVDPIRRPRWVTLWEPLRRALDSNGQLDPRGENWLAALGLIRPPTPRVLVLLVYRAGEVATLVRPTQLDAGAYPWYFPSPEHLHAQHGGHCLDTGPAAEDEPLLREYVHAWMPYEVEHWRAGGEVWCRADPRPLADPTPHRERHLRRLERAYGPSIGAWYPAP